MHVKQRVNHLTAVLLLYSRSTYLSLYLIIQELLFEGDEGIVCTVVVQIQWVQHIPESDAVGSYKYS